jgi:PKD repeat protein
MKNGVSAGFYLFLTLFIVAGMTVPGLIIAQDFSGTPTSGTAPLEVQFTDESADTPTGWAWYFGDEDWTAKTWSEVDDSAPWSERNYHTSVVLPDGSIVLMGGTGSSINNDVWRSEDQGASWTELTDSAPWTARQLHSSVVLPDGSIVIMGGNDGSYRNDVWRSLDQGETWTEETDAAEWSARAYHTSVALPDGSILLMGGDDGSRKNDVWRSEDQGATWTQVTAAAEWTAVRRHTSVVLPDGSIVLMGGYAGGRRNDVWRSEDQGATWTQVTAAAEWTRRMDHTSVVLPDGSIVLMGGDDGLGSRRNDVWRSEDQGATWTQMIDSAEWTERSFHTSVVLPDGSIVLMGGNDDSLKNDIWRMETAASSDENPEHTYSEAGTYNVALQAYNAEGFGNIQKAEYIEVTETPLFCGGEGTEANPYLICTADQLNNIREDLSAHYKLANDIDLDVAPYNVGEGWQPIGTYIGWEDSGNIPFRGSLDGNNKSILNLFVNYTTGTKMAALFELTDGADFKDIDFTNVDITSMYYAGALVGMAFNTEMANISSSGQIVGVTRVGGLIGAGYDSNITESSSSCSVEAVNGTDVGGLVGEVDNTIVTNSFATGSVKNSDDYESGGLIGSAAGTSVISNCYATGDVTTVSNEAGGLIGYVNYDVKIINSYATGDVNGGSNSDDVGGLVGYFRGDEIFNAYATGDVKGRRSTGGLAGHVRGSSVSIKNAYSSGAVDGEQDTGGLIGELESGTISNSFYDSQTSGQSDTGKGTPKTTAEMKLQSTFTTSGSDWDFDNLWAIESGDHISYPYFGNSEEAPEQDPPPGLTQVGGFAENPRLIAAAGKKTAVTTAHILFGDDDEVTITRKPYRGRLLLDGTEVVNGDEVLKTEVEGNELEFEHEGDRTESEYWYTDFLYATSAEERTLPVDLAARGIAYGYPEGWFLFSSPETDQTVGDLLRNMRTDGYPGSTNPGASFPTVYTLNQEAYEWAAVTGSDQKLVPGTALLVYVFEEDTPKNPMLFSNGPWAPLDGTFTYDELLGYDPNQGSGGNSFYLIGNPHPVPIDICRMLREGENIATSFYAWMPDENDGNGGYVNYSCEIPSKIQSIMDMNGRPSTEFRVPAFAGFWVRTTAENPELSITENDYLITTRKEVEELPEPLTLELAHSSQDYANRVHILLRDDAETGLDRIDAIKMSSAGLAENYLSFYALDEENRKYALRSLPAYLEEPVNIPLAVETTVSGDYTLRWSPPSEEYGLVYRLRDRVTGAEYNLGSEGELNLTITETGEGAINRFTVAISTEGFISEPELPTSIALKQNYPNPFNPTTVIEYQLPQSAQVRLQVYDMSGRQVAELVNEQISAGTHTINFDASNLSSGVYMYRLQAGTIMLTRKLTVVK